MINNREKNKSTPLKNDLFSSTNLKKKNDFLEKFKFKKKIIIMIMINNFKKKKKKQINTS